MSRVIALSAAMAALGAMGCTGSDSARARDSATAADSVRAATIADSIRMDGARAMESAPAPTPFPRGILPPDGGETHRTGSTVSPREQRVDRTDRADRDPPPNLIGETRSGTMGRRLPPTIGRDSSHGPKFTIDENGNVTPIRR